ncbi:hypothetical protein CAEBREN_04534 [Caenorhabditis brenneri]|uniref:Uncharacterized protein n=1 Tax=Caenorhabditis brenneri TaxID=135651 RepID=G0P1A1_CAEBE|nr:hypothetical protein CAEBREN_04534 [Caenorhabditis brenneri]
MRKSEWRSCVKTPGNDKLAHPPIPEEALTSPIPNKKLTHEAQKAPNCPLIGWCPFSFLNSSRNRTFKKNTDSNLIKIKRRGGSLNTEGACGEIGKNEMVGAVRRLHSGERKIVWERRSAESKGQATQASIIVCPLFCSQPSVLGKCAR